MQAEEGSGAGAEAEEGSGACTGAGAGAEEGAGAGVYPVTLCYLAGRDDALLPEDEGCQSLVGDLLGDHWTKRIIR